MHPTPLHLLLPFALSALEANLELAAPAPPAYARLLRQATLIERSAGAAFQRVLPHENWLARCFEVAPPHTEIEAAPFAPYMLLAEGGEPSTALWTCVQPVHLQIAHDHLVLANPASLALTQEEAFSLLEAARPAFTAFNLSLATPTPYRWYLSGEALGEWLSSAPLRASGRNIEIWLPTDRVPAHAQISPQVNPQIHTQAKHQAKPSAAHTRAWLKLQNEVQMLWFDHPVNRAREAHGQATVNSIWLYGQGRLAPVARPFTHIFSDAATTRGLGLAARAQVASVPSSFAELNLLPTTGKTKHQTTRPSTLIELEHFTHAFIQQDALAQQEAFTALEHNWFAPALQALKNGMLPSLTLTLCGETEYLTLQLTRADLRKFWRRRSLASLLTLNCL